MARDVLADRRTLPESAARPREIGGGRKKEECPRHSTSCLRPPSSYGPRYHAAHMPLGSLRAWLGLDREETNEYAPLRDILERLDHLPPDRARYLAAFAYLLGRVAGADQHVSAGETQTKAAR